MAVPDAAIDRTNPHAPPDAVGPRRHPHPRLLPAGPHGRAGPRGFVSGSGVPLALSVHHNIPYHPGMAKAVSPGKAGDVTAVGADRSLSSQSDVRPRPEGSLRKRPDNGHIRGCISTRNAPLPIGGPFLGRSGFDHHIGHLRPLRMAVSILTCHRYLKMGRWGLAQRRLG